MKWKLTRLSKPEIGRHVITSDGKKSMFAYYNGRNFFEWNTEEIVPIEPPEYWMYLNDVTRPKKFRSAAENSYMHFAFNLIAEHTGHTMQEIKDFYKVLYKVESTAELSTSECEDFLSAVRMHSADFFKIYVPLPNEAMYG